MGASMKAMSSRVLAPLAPYSGGRAVERTTGEDFSYRFSLKSEG